VELPRRDVELPRRDVELPRRDVELPRLRRLESGEWVAEFMISLAKRFVCIERLLRC